MRIHAGADDRQPDGSVVFVTDAMTEAGAITLAQRHHKKGELHLFPRLITVGMGEHARVALDDLRAAAGQATRAAEKEGWRSASVALPNLFPAPEEAQAITEGALLGAYTFDRYKSQPADKTLVDLYLVGQDLTDGVRRGAAFAEATALARDLANEPPNILRPAVLADFVVRHFAGTGASVSVYADDELLREQLVGIYTVGKGSAHKPRFIEIRYASDPARPLVAFVGKGITFDTGGISLKSGRDISDMRFDMAGAAAVIGAVHGLVATDTPCNVVGLIAAAENIPDAGSMLPGELIQYPNGVSVQVANTDAEGRLVLADGLIRAGELGARFTVDIATLTGAAAAALGPRYAAVFGTEPLVTQLLQSGEKSGDFLWQMPLPDEYREQLKSTYADISNIGKGQGGAITAALFLQHFVAKDSEWAHIDMAGPMQAETTMGYKPAGATGFGARVLLEAAALLSR
ncbi:MAG: leucyl aminopeptidase family protein [Bacilli bacterium]